MGIKEEQRRRSELAKKELGQLVEERISDMEKRDPVQAIEDMLQAKAEEMEAERRRYYEARGGRKRSAQIRKERSEQAAAEALRRQEERERKRQEKEEESRRREEERAALAEARTLPESEAEAPAETGTEGVSEQPGKRIAEEVEAQPEAHAETEGSISDEPEPQAGIKADVGEGFEPQAEFGADAAEVSEPQAGLGAGAAEVSEPQAGAKDEIPFETQIEAEAEDFEDSLRSNVDENQLSIEGAEGVAEDSYTPLPDAGKTRGKERHIGRRPFIPSIGKLRTPADIGEIGEGEDPGDKDRDSKAKLRQVIDEISSYVKEEAFRKRDTIVPPGSPKPPEEGEAPGQISLFTRLSPEEKKSPKRRKEGALERLIRFVKSIRKQRVLMSGQPYYSSEKKRAAYIAIYKDCFSPIADAIEDINDGVWNYVVSLFTGSAEIASLLGSWLSVLGFQVWSLVLSAWDFVWDVRYWVEINKARVFKNFVYAVILAAIAAVFLGSITAYEYIYYGKTLGIARSKEDVYKTIEILGDKLSEASGANVSLDVERDIEFRKVMGLGLEIDSDDDILNTLTYMKELHVRAFGIFVAGEEEPKVILESEFIANNILKNIKSIHAAEKKDVEYRSVEFGEKVSVREIGVQLGDIWNAGEATSYLMTGTQKQLIHRVEEGETFGEIAKANGLSIEQLIASNPGIDIDRLKIGQGINLTAASPILSVHSTEIATYYETIPFDTNYIDDSSIYVGETEIKSRGVPGQQQIMAEVERVNGVETGRRELSSRRIVEPVVEVRYRGTKPIPERKGTGTFIYPAKSYRITSRFGMRWGRMHTGVDLANSVGTKIYASDGGTVTFAGWKGELGNLIIIDHGSLLETYYGHCSKLLVGVGDKVYQGQNIALMGSTGRSTGPHLHFEVRYNGEPKNPLDYL